MINQNAINQNVLNGNSKIYISPISHRRGTIFFTDEELNEFNLTEMCGADVNNIEGFQVLSGPLYDTDFEVSILEKEIDDGGILTNKRLKTKTISLEIFLKEKNNYNLRKKIDEIKGLLVKKQGYLELKFFDGFRRVFGTFPRITFENLNFSDDYVFGKLDFTFLIPYFEKENGQTFFAVGNGQVIKEYKLDGNYGNDFRCKINIKSNCSYLELIFGKSQIYIDEPLYLGDEIFINSKENRVFLNGNEIAFLGNFGDLKFGLQNFEIGTDGQYDYQVKVDNLFV